MGATVAQEIRLGDLFVREGLVSEAQLDQDDPAWYELTAERRSERALELERALDTRQDDAVISTAVHVADGQADAARVMSNGFADQTRGAWFSLGGETTLRDANGRRPEAWCLPAP